MSPEARYPQLGEIILADKVIITGLSPQRARALILLLAASVALMMTGFGIILPVFARRLGEFGAGVQELGLMTMSFALAQLIAAPFLGSMADRYGRRPFILLALAAFVAANISFLFAQSSQAFIIIRAFEGALTAGLFPAAMGVVSDLIPKEHRARWVGIVMGGYAAGFFFGPVLGGLLYDTWGYAMPFIASAIMGVLALAVAIFLVPETRTDAIRNREMLLHRRELEQTGSQGETLWKSLPRPLYIFATLLLIDFVMIFAFAFIEPQMIFYMYDDLGWTTVQFGVVVAVYGLVAVIGQGFLGGISDRIGRKPVIILGLGLNTFFYAGVAYFRSFPLILVVSFLSGFGEALVMPALSAYYMDITAEQHRSRVMGIKESAAALGGVAGPLLVIAASEVTTPQGIFLIAFILTVVTAGLAIILLRPPIDFSKQTGEMGREYAVRRAMVARATLRGIVTSARTERRNQVIL
jgi:multidrug resistance protein